MFDTANQWAPLILAISTGIAAIFLVLKSKNRAALTSGSLCIVLFLISNLSQIETLKGLGVEARIRNQLQNSVSILINIKSIAEALAYNSYIFAITSSSGNILPLDQGLETRGQLNEFVTKQEIVSSRILNVKKRLQLQLISQMAYRCRVYIIKYVMGSDIIGSWGYDNVEILNKKEFIDHVIGDRMANLYMDSSTELAKKERALQLVDRCATDAFDIVDNNGPTIFMRNVYNLTPLDEK